MEPSAVGKLSGKSAIRALRAVGVKPSRVPIALTILTLVAHMAAGQVVPMQIADAVATDMVLSKTADVAQEHQFGNSQTTSNIRQTSVVALESSQPSEAQAITFWNVAPTPSGQTNFSKAVVAASIASFQKLEDGCKKADAEWAAAANARAELRASSLAVFKPPPQGRFESTSAYNKRVNSARKIHNNAVKNAAQRLKNAKSAYIQECKEELATLEKSIAIAPRAFAEGSQALQVAVGTVNARIEAERTKTAAEANAERRRIEAEAATKEAEERAVKAEANAAAAEKEAKAAKNEAKAATNLARKMTTMSAAEKQKAANNAKAAERKAQANARVSNAASAAAKKARERAARAGLNEAQQKAKANRAAENAAAAARRWNQLAGLPGRAGTAFVQAATNVIYIVATAFFLMAYTSMKTISITKTIANWAASASAYTLLMMVAAIVGYVYGGKRLAIVGALTPLAIGAGRLLLKGRRASNQTSPRSANQAPPRITNQANQAARAQTNRLARQAAARAQTNRLARQAAANAARKQQQAPVPAVFQPWQQAPARVNNNNAAYKAAYNAAQRQRQTLRANVAARKRQARLRRFV